MIRKPTIELQSLLITQVRNANTNSDRFKLKNLVKGFSGEMEFDQWVEKYGQNNWEHIKDIRLSAGVPTQIDSLLLTPSGIYIYDIKNYNTKCSYFNRKLLINGKEATHDIFIQSEYSLERVKAVLREIDYHGPIHFYILFINEHCQLSCDSDLRPKCIMRNELREHFLNLSNQISQKIDINILKTKLLTYQVENPYDKSLFRPEQIEKMKLGVYCSKCYSFQMKYSRTQCLCQNCGHIQSKKSALKQLISEAGILKFNKAVSRKDVYHLSGEKFSKNYLGHTMSKVAQLNHIGRYANYANPNELYNWKDLIKQFQ